MTKDLASKNNEIQETAESVLIVAALGDISAGTEASADFFNKGFPEKHPARVSRQTVWHWANGSKRVSDYRLRFWMHYYPDDDDRKLLAISILAYRDREVMSPISAHVIGKPFTSSKKTSSKATV